MIDAVELHNGLKPMFKVAGWMLFFASIVFFVVSFMR